MRTEKDISEFALSTPSAAKSFTRFG